MSTAAPPDDSQGQLRYDLAGSPDDPVALWRSKFIDNGEPTTITELGLGVQDSSPVWDWQGSSHKFSVFVPSTVKVIRGRWAFNFTISGLVFAEDSQLSVIKGHSFFQVILASIFIPPSVEVIAQAGFRRCWGLKEMLFAEHSRLKDIQAHAFRSCSLKSIAIPASVEHLGSGCFSDSAINVVTFADGSPLQEIPSFLFSNDDDDPVPLRRFTIPASVEVVGDYSFTDCHELRALIFAEPSKVRMLGAGAFDLCDRLKSILLPASIEDIARDCFFRCAGLASVIFAEPAKVRSLGVSAFADCIALRSIRLPASIEVIGETCFRGCRCLTSVSFAEDSHLKTVGRNAFAESGVDDVSFLNGFKNLRQSDSDSEQ